MEKVVGEEDLLCVWWGFAVYLGGFSSCGWLTAGLLVGEASDREQKPFWLFSWLSRFDLLFTRLFVKGAGETDAVITVCERSGRNRRS